MIDRLKDLISEGEIKKAIDVLLSYAKQVDNKDLYKEAVAQSNRFETYIQKKLTEPSSQREEDITIAKINNAILDIADRLSIGNIPSNSPQSSTTSPIDTPPKGKWWKWIVGLGLLIAIPAGIAEFTGYQLKDWFSPTSTDSNTVTVLVHGKNGKDELVLPNRGIVKLIYGDAIVPKQINADGEATFKQINDVFFNPDVEVEIVFQDPERESYRAANPDLKYKLTKGQYIPFEVHLYGLGKVSGIVKDFKTGKALKDARISIQQEEAFSNEYGEFTLVIPEAKQQQFQTIRATKEGYLDYEISNVPIQTQKEIPILLKPMK